MQLTFSEKVGYRWPAKQLWVNFAKFTHNFGATRIAGMSNERQMFTRGEIFPKSDTCQDDKYIATGFVLFDLDCVRRLKNSHVRWSGLDSRGWGWGWGGCYFGMLSPVVDTDLVRFPPDWHGLGATVGTELSQGWSNHPIVPPLCSPTTQTFLNLEVPLWPSLEFGPHNHNLKVVKSVHEKIVTIGRIENGW